MNKLLKSTLGIVGLCLLLTGCSGGQDPSQSVDPSTPTQPTTQTTTQPSPQDYYASINDSMMGDTLKVALYNIIHPTKCTTNYNAIWNYLKNCDAYDPDNNSDSRVIAFYRGTGGSVGDMNKEHVWPKSRGGACIEGDPHMVRPTFKSDNTSRGNDFYNVAPTSYDPNEFGATVYRGICARIIFYCATQEYQNLKIVDKTTDSTTSTTSGTMGKLSTLLKWNLEYAVQPSEQLRNDVLSGYRKSHGVSYKFNRNPFIDHPEYACRIWGSTNSTTRSICGM